MLNTQAHGFNHGAWDNDNLNNLNILNTQAHGFNHGAGNG